MMDFFEAQEQARRRSYLLVVMFAAGVVGIVAVVYAVAHFVIGPGRGGIDTVLLGQVALGVGLVVGVGSAFRTASLRSGGPAVADLLGARRIAPDATDPGERRFINIVEEMAVAAGTPVPAAYVMDGEDGINAFAAGYSPHDAAVAVTRGALTQLTRDELQGVIAHEFSHILNGDMRLNVRLIGMIYGILLLAVVGRAVLYMGPRGRRGGGRDGGGHIALIGLALLVVGYIGMFFGKLIKAAVSRQREYLADSAAVEFTRNPLGLAGALKKIGAAAAGSRVTNPHAEELSHLFFANGVGRSLSQSLSTHPPLDDRIRRLDPGWTGEFDAAPLPTRRTGSAAPGRAARTSGAVAGLAGPAAAQPPTAAAAMASVGAPRPEHLALARSLLENLPRSLEDAIHTTPGARALVLALAMSDSAGPDLEAEWAVVRREGDPSVADRVGELLPLVRARMEQRLPLLDLALPSLLRLGPDEVEHFLDTVHATVTADARVRLFEYTMLRTLTRRLRGGGPAEQPRRTRSFGSLAEPTAALLSALAWTGSGWDEGTARKAFAAGVARLPSEVGSIEFRPVDDISIEGIDRALSSFEQASPAVRKWLLEACVDVALHDSTVTHSEMELVRAVAEALDCPMPPLAALVGPSDRTVPADTDSEDVR